MGLVVRGMWDLPGPGTHVPALAGMFLTTAPPWKPCSDIFIISQVYIKVCVCFWTLLSVPFVNLPVFMPVLHHLLLYLYSKS